MVEYTVTYPETITLRKTSDSRYFLYYLMWPSDKTFGDPGQIIPRKSHTFEWKG